MFTITAQSHFDSAHFLSGYEGKCSNLHGHRWVVEATVLAEQLHDSGQLKGMVVDFGDIKKALKDLVDFYDHSMIYEEGTLKAKTIEALSDEGFRIIKIDFRPTAECFAKHFHDALKAQGFNLSGVTVFETPTNRATYSEVSHV
ncbi:MULTISPECIES: 6-carboxytetrahydropterin synthase QueD [unclassified Fusibacter]|uniref:6-carboxytetrahydropterin synthase QueD n=1 Tax=unclassified Fusibacter TaxID=2624464 RepID=UPI0010102CB2|nr:MULTISPECIES: 6-carboxytetrahydropterin synthase QueD [unclassified Fusibacter]MCK8059780.1 6-carboxytetrahydropterin synthase QueD [Fusibacter sp. A2]NPE21581.1 6-carboxytetrahydropterin synthase QueD [Fusibacter sp. A1]RXV61989.1 6-carboxytetrahydropterin synthase QueD [Fusibacter sp. A1]